MHLLAKAPEHLFHARFVHAGNMDTVPTHYHLLQLPSPTEWRIQENSWVVAHFLNNLASEKKTVGREIAYFWIISTLG
jgi:hypothetical protein